MSDETYSLEDVERLLGLREHPGPTAPRHLTLLDIRSLARSPGGDPYWLALARRDPNAESDWTDLVGPLAPDSDLALTLFDFERAVSDLRRREELSLREFAILSLLVMGWTPAEIAVFLREARSTITRGIRGRPRRDRDGQPIPGERTGGIAPKVHRAMNTPGPAEQRSNGHAPKPKLSPAEESALHWGRV